MVQYQSEVQLSERDSRETHLVPALFSLIMVFFFLISGKSFVGSVILYCDVTDDRKKNKNLTKLAVDQKTFGARGPQAVALLGPGCCFSSPGGNLNLGTFFFPKEWFSTLIAHQPIHTSVRQHNVPGGEQAVILLEPSCLNSGNLSFFVDFARECDARILPTTRTSSLFTSQAACSNLTDHENKWFVYIPSSPPLQLSY